MTNVLVKYKVPRLMAPSLSWVSSISLLKVSQIGSGSEHAQLNWTTNATELPVNYTTVLGNQSYSASDIFLNITIEPLHLELCPLVPPKLVGRLKVMTDVPKMSQLEECFPDLEPGGRFKPPNCTARFKVAIVIPYRDREQHLRIFLHNIHPILQRQQLDYGIYVIEESGKTKFNRAMLMNIGFVEASKDYDYDCFIYHDVDLIPEDDRNLYTCPTQPRHMSVAIDIFNYRLPYNDIFGGVSALTRAHMEKVNGFSNEFWGWGGEDDDMSNRLRFHGLRITRYPAKIARYKMLRHSKDEPNPDRYNKLYKGRKRFKTDGLNSLKYKRLDFVLKKLFTWVLVDVTPQMNQWNYKLLRVTKN